MAEVVNCPICHRSVPFEDPNMPFCSDRCRLMDLANWATEKYVIPSPEQPGDLEDIEPSSHHERSYLKSS